MLNRIVIQGRVTRDLELRRTQSGLSVTSFSLAVERDFKNESGERGVDFIDCVAWRDTAEFVAKYFSKGKMMILDGRLQSRKYQDKNGNNRVAWEVLTDHAYFCGEKSSDNSAGVGQYGSAPDTGTAPKYGGGYGGYDNNPAGYDIPPDGGNFSEISDDDDDLPFLIE